MQEDQSAPIEPLVRSDYFEKPEIEIADGEILVFCCLRNEAVRLPFFLKYYRDMGVSRFFVIDNGSDDGSAELLKSQPDVEYFHTLASYTGSSAGRLWMQELCDRYGVGHWCLTVDPDELFVFPFCDTRPLRALTDWLDASSIKSFSAMLLDMYPKAGESGRAYAAGDDPLQLACWFDSANYAITRNPRFRNLWIQGGPRARAFFADQPKAAPALNKIPLVKWQRGYAYVSSTHMLLPRGLNLTYDTIGGEKASGCLLHAKFLATLGDKAQEELARGEHYREGREYAAYARGLDDTTDLWTKWSERFINWRQLEIMGLMSKGNWA